MFLRRALLTLMIVALMVTFVTPAIGIASADGRLPAHAYLPGAHELPKGLVESANRYEELPNGSFATRTFSIAPIYTMQFSVFSHDDPWLAREGMLGVIKRGEEIGLQCMMGAGSSGADEEYICHGNAGSAGAVLWGLRVGNRAATALTIGPTYGRLVELSQAAARIQDYKLRRPG